MRPFIALLLLRSCLRPMCEGDAASSEVVASVKVGRGPIHPWDYGVSRPPALSIADGRLGAVFGTDTVGRNAAFRPRPSSAAGRRPARSERIVCFRGRGRGRRPRAFVGEGPMLRTSGVDLDCGVGDMTLAGLVTTDL